MTRKTSPIAQTTITRAVKGAEAAGISVKSIRIEPDGAVVINGDIANKPPAPIDREIQAEMVSLQAWREKHGNKNGRDTHS